MLSITGDKNNSSVYNTGGQEAPLASYCQDSTVDVFAIGFVHQIVNGKPVLNLANHCETTFPGSNLLSCPQIGADIKTCQSKGKAVVISIGGAAGAYALDTPEQGTAFAQQVWDTFLGGSSSQRPFGNAVLDGVDLDLESGTNRGYPAFVNALRAKFASSSKSFYITAAPQCPYPDHALSAALNAAWFDLVWVQFYNNYCGTQSYGTGSFNFDQWNNWATTVSINKNVRILLGVPGGPGGAGSGIVTASQLTNILNGVKSYSNFGGVMLWDAGISAKSGLSIAAANYLNNGGPKPTTPPKPSSTTTAPPTSTQTGGACSAPAWNAGTAYSGGAVVSYNGRKYTAKWWTQGDVPSSSGSPWTDNGPCSGSNTGNPGTPGGCNGVTAWNSATAYTTGSKVTYGGYEYTAQWWTQGETPGTNSVWTRGASCSGTAKRRLYAAKRFVKKRR
ncbi:Chitinase 1 [Actinomortierella ambigua]|nr:Chitinase 1 [Actinomortierella ambigua]